MSEITLKYPVKEHSQVTQRFGENPGNYAQFGRAGHNGIDFGVPAGTEVFAAADGVIEKIGYDKDGYGNYIKIFHEKFFTLYAHLWQIQTKKGKKVKAGDLIGNAGSTGNSTGPHLHFELRIPEKIRKDYPAGEVDPEPYFVEKEGQTPEPISVEGEEPEVIKITEGDFAMVNSEIGLNVRLGAGTNHRAIGGLLDGEQVKVNVIEDGWAQIILYVKAEYLKEKVTE